MLSRRRPPRASRIGPILAVAAAAAAGAWPFLAGGCGREMACIEWRASDGACPERAEAFARMSVPCGRVQSVDSAGEFDDGTCCYEVTQSGDTESFCGTGPTGQATGGPAGVTSSSSGPGGCSGIIAGECGACAEQGCCNELFACATNASCVSCVNEGTCGADIAAAQQADALFGCIAAAQCSDDPCQVNPKPAPGCDPPAVAPSNGTCVLLGGTVQCNPVTNEGCQGDLGQFCDRTVDGFACFPESYANAICAGCGATQWCGAGATCYAALCAKYCCSDGDCGSGVCSLGAIPMPTDVGICVQKTTP